MIVYVIIIITVLVSVQGFRDNVLLNRLAYNPHRIKYHNEYYRVFSHGLVHADWMHLGVNMFVLYVFASSPTTHFGFAVNGNGQLLFTILYLSALPISSAMSYRKQKDNPYYTAIGASGAVSAVLFAYIYHNPWNLLYLFGIIPIPGILFGIGYLYYSYTMSKKNIDNIGHDAHLWGALYGFAFTMIVRPSSLADFIEKLIPC